LNQKIDLHSHSNCSDGALSPVDLVRRALDKGVQALALTDHDTTVGLAEATIEATQAGLTLVPGIELSCQWGGATVHVLGLGIDAKSPVMVSAVAHQNSVRAGRAEIIAEKLAKKHNMPGLLEGIDEFSGQAIPARPHFAKKMVAMGYVDSVREAFNGYLGAGKTGDVKAGWPEVSELCEWINGSGGVAVIAHPRKYNFTLTKLRRLFDEFKSVGGRGIEVSVGGQKQGETGLLADLCRRYGFLASAGSDFHSPGLPWCELGNFPRLPDNMQTVASCLELNEVW
jgi:hypothetical protein